MGPWYTGAPTIFPRPRNVFTHCSIPYRVLKKTPINSARKAALWGQRGAHRLPSPADPRADARCPGPCSRLRLGTDRGHGEPARALLPLPTLPPASFFAAFSLQTLCSSTRSPLQPRNRAQDQFKTQTSPACSVHIGSPADSRGFPYGGRWLYLSFLAALIHAPGRPGRGMVTPCNPSPCGLIKPSFPPRPPSGRWRSLTGLCGVTARSPGFASTPRLLSGWILLHKTVALQEAPKAAPCPARTHCTYNSCPHNHGRPHRAISPPRAAPQRTQGPSAPPWQARAENQQQRSGDRPGLQPNQHFWGEGCC